VTGQIIDAREIFTCSGLTAVEKEINRLLMLVYCASNKEVEPSEVEKLKSLIGELYWLWLVNCDFPETLREIFTYFRSVLGYPDGRTFIYGIELTDMMEEITRGLAALIALLGPPKYNQIPYNEIPIQPENEGDDF